VTTLDETLTACTPDESAEVVRMKSPALEAVLPREVPARAEGNPKEARRLRRFVAALLGALSAWPT